MSEPGRPWTEDASALLASWEEETYFSIRYYESVGSTNEAVKQEIKRGAAQGFTAVAEEQTAGKGRIGRAWSSPAGEAIYASLCLRPPIAPAHAPMLTLVAGLSVAQAIRGCCELPVRIKWPNDVVIGNRKVCGILTEAVTADGELAGIVIGMGINVMNRSFPAEIADRATSLYLAGGKEIQRGELLASILHTFRRNYEIFLRTENMEALLPAYHARLAGRNETVRVEDPAGPYTGTMLGIDEGGRLLVKRGDGCTVQVDAGEVSVRGMYGYI